MFFIYSSEGITFILSGIAVLLLLVGFNIYFLFFYRKKQGQHAVEKQKMEEHYQHILLQSQLEIQEELLQHVSREIHDNLGQVAALVKLNLVSFPDGLSEEADKRLQHTRVLMQKLMLDIKTLSLSLNMDYLQEEGLVKALEGECNRIRLLQLLQVDFSSEGLFAGMNPGWQIIVYRMFQETVSNVFKYAQATALSVEVKTENDIFTLVIADNGIGFPVEETLQQAFKNGSTGIKGMQKRMNLIGGSLTIHSSAGNGTRVTMVIPLNKTLYAENSPGNG